MVMGEISSNKGLAVSLSFCAHKQTEHISIRMHVNESTLYGRGRILLPVPDPHPVTALHVSVAPLNCDILNYISSIFVCLFVFFPIIQFLAMWCSVDIA